MAEAVVVQFQHRQARAEQEAAAAAAQQLRQLPDGMLQKLPPVARLAISRAEQELQRAACPDPDKHLWPGGFVMLSRIQTEAVWDAIWTIPGIARRNQVHRAFDLMMLYVRQDTGEVMLSLDDFAKKIGTAPYNVSRVMGTLERLGVVTRKRRRIPGVQGPGEAVYVVNCHVAWNGRLELRKEIAARTAPPSLQLVKDGAQEP